MSNPPVITVMNTRDMFDPALAPERFAGVRRRRMMAFVIDFLIVLAISIVPWLIVLVLGLLTFGLAWGLIGAVFPAVAILYTAVTVSGPAGATIGMRSCGLEMRMWYGDRVAFVLAAAHVILFYVSVTVLTPFVLLVSLFDPKKRLLHDLVLGTVMLNDAQQAAALRR